MANNQIDYSKEFFTIVALEDGLTVKFSRNASEYRIDNGEWISLDKDTATTSINSGQKISFKITNPTIYSGMGIGTFTVNKAFNVNGNIMSLLYGDNFDGQIDLSGKNYAFYQLFQNCTTLQNAENLILLATTLANYCYQGMFNGCTNLTTAPALPATTLASSCYQYMFYGCSNLNYIKMLATNISASNCLSYWVYRVARSGTFVKNAAMTSLPSGVNGIPNGWTVKNYNENISNKKYLDKAGLTTLWGIIKAKFATKAETITNVGIVDAADKATLIFTYADNTAENPHTLDIVINPVSETNAGLMTPEMLSQLETAVDGTISNLELNYNSTTKKLQLFDGAVIEGNVLTEIDATAFVNDGMLSSAELVVNPAGMADGTYLKLVWNSDAGKTEPMYVNVTQLIDIYTSGDGIKIENKVISCTYTYTLPVANDFTLGGIKTGYTEVEGVKKYAVKVDGTGNAYVAVDWEDTTYSVEEQNNNLVKLDLENEVFSIDETALTDRLDGINTAVSSKIASITGDNALISVDTDANKAVTVVSTNKLSAAVDKAEKSIQGVGADDNNIIDVEKDKDNNVTLSVGTALDTAITNANSAVQEINIGELEIKKDTYCIASVEHDVFVEYFAITTDDLNKICS